MTKKQLIEALAPYPDNMEVFMAERKTEFSYGLLNSVISKEVKFTEDPDADDDYEGPEAFDTVIILDEE